MARVDSDGKAVLSAVLLAAVAPAIFALLLVLSDTIGVRGSQPLVDVLVDGLYVLALISVVASGFVGGLLGGVVMTAWVWGWIAVAVYVAADPSCPLEMSRRGPNGVAAIEMIVSASVDTCMGGATPTRGNNVGFVILGGAAATLLAMVGALVGAANRKRPSDRG